jgi:hypothetical protein
MPIAVLIVVPFLVAVASCVVVCAPMTRPTREPSSARPDRSPPGLGVGTVRAVDGSITVDVEGLSGQHFVGRLRRPGDGASLDDLRPGTVLLVTFDPSVREQLSLADDMAAVRVPPR